QGEIEARLRAQGGEAAGEEDRMEVVEAAVLSGVEGGRRVDVEADRAPRPEAEGREGEDARAGADVEDSPAGDFHLLEQLEGQGGRLVAADPEGGARWQ